MIEKRQPISSAQTFASPEQSAYKLMCEGRLDEALQFAKGAVASLETCTPTHGMLATILCRLGRADEAESVVVTALQLAPGVADAYDALAHVSMTLGQHQRANALYRRAAEREPLAPRFWYNLASSERSLGHTAAAEEACNRSIALDRLHYPSYPLRSELRVQTAESNHIAELQSLLAARGLDTRGRAALSYALGKELDDLSRYDEAFKWFSEGARARRGQLAYDVEVDEKKLKRITETYSLDYFSGDCPRNDSARYIFIVGLPRSGTTLLERILTGLKGVRSNGETDNFARALLESTPAGSDDVFSRATSADAHQVALKYAKFAGAAATEDVIIEKMPLNYLYLGAIHRALPQAKLLLMKRAPLDSCFAMYRTLFGVAYPFSYDFEDLARYYAAYDRLVSHWRLAFGTYLYEIRYDDLVMQPTVTAAAVAKYCGLHWRESAIQVERNDHASFTASASQIRRPIYDTSAGRCRHYRHHLQPLERRLEDLSVNLGGR